MNYRRLLNTSILILLSLFLSCSIASTGIPNSLKIDDVPRVKQLRNYCGPACVAAVMRHYGMQVTQEAVGREVYDAASGATNGADMLYYARERGFAAYSWNTSLADIKKKLSAGVPVIALQQNSSTDTSGHYRVLTGYDDAAGKFYVMDPYYDNITELSYSQTEKWWGRMGYWALLITPTDKDKFKGDLDIKNAVVHMDLAFAKYKRKDYNSALTEANLALNLEPGNRFAVSMVDKIERAMGAGAKKK